MVLKQYSTDAENLLATQGKQTTEELWNNYTKHQGWLLDRPYKLTPLNYQHLVWGGDTEDVVAVDIESNGQPWYSKQFRVLCVGFCDGDKSWVLNPGVKGEFGQISRILNDRKVAKVFHNGMDFDLLTIMLSRMCVQVGGAIHDTILMARCANNLEPLVGLDALGKKYCRMPKIEVKRPWELPRDELYEYNKRDVEITWLLWHHYMKRKDRSAWWGTYERELQLTPVIHEMYQSAMQLDYEWCVRNMLEWREEIKRLEEPWNEAGVNHRSGKQMNAYLYGTGKLKPVDGQPKTKDGYSIAEAWIKRHITSGKTPPRWRDQLKSLLDLRGLEKDLKYVQSLVEHSRFDGRVHGALHPYRAKTGRWGSREPNLQQIPGKPRFVRHAFYYTDNVYGQGYDLWSYDYDQMELRMCADLAGDKGLIQAFRDGRDIHTENARRITDGNRDHAKVVIYAFIYGSGAATMAETLRVPVDQAEGWLRNLNENMPAVRGLMNRQKAKLQKQGHIITRMGRKLRCEELYQGVDYEIQGTGADILKDRAIKFWRWLRTNKLKSRIVLLIHDEVVVAIHKSEKKVVQGWLDENMPERELFKEVELTVSKGLFHDKG